MKLYLSTLILTFAFLLPNYAYAQSNSKLLNTNQHNDVGIKQNNKITNQWYKYTSKDGTYSILHSKAPQEEEVDKSFCAHTGLFIFIT